jgi:phenylalanyl-tRNA synthetase beta chain
MVHPATLKAFDVDGPVAAVELFLDAIPAKKGVVFARPGFTPPALQAVTRDFAFLVPVTLAVGDGMDPAKTLEEIRSTYCYRNLTDD